eukprot:TRINITY_DN3775_c0_g1_i4.p1 TRINITY_DN3775_c0_g1~~TRINITY_DN3775_c0_g1_i4.p1  ORF type:complete len:526 (-),score=96.19 TRINITY_DN3775_c0_g1_i4:32-1609(-)
MTEAVNPNPQDQKYDRQLRLWGSHGQKLLAEANVLLIGGSAVGTETLKNLILPGLGQFSILDSEIVTNADLGRNFFVELDDVGKSRAETTAKNLHELNPDCKKSTPIKKSLEDVLNSPEFFDSFSVVIVTGAKEDSLIKLSDLCYDKDIPLVVVDIFGFFGYLRLQTKEHTVVESHPEFFVPDLRLNAPFQALIDYANKIHLDKEHMTSKEHSHVPYPIILLKAIEHWKKDHDGKIPSNSQAKDEFKKFISTMSWNPKEVNFQEAFQSAHLVTLPPRIPSEVEAVLNDEKAKNLTKESSNFWILANAVSDFVKNEGKGLLPLSGAIPDMTALTENYIELQNIYSTEAESHVKIIKSKVEKSLTSLGKDTTSISYQEVQNFCKNAAFICCVRNSKLSAEYNSNSSNFNMEALEMDSNGNGPWYVGIRAGHKFRLKYNKYPEPGDSNNFKPIVDELVKHLGFPEDYVTEDHIAEILRVENANLHTVAAILGGIASQEVLKVITHQWIPLDNTFFFNGLSSSSSTLKL